MRRTLAVTAVGVLALTSAGYAAGGHGHGNHHGDHQMAKLHQMMPKYGAAQARVAAALDEGDLKAVLEETSYILSTVADLKKSKPHKNLVQLKEFRDLGAVFEQEIKKVSVAAQKGDAAGARVAFEKAHTLCDTCHAKFRD